MFFQLIHYYIINTKGNVIFSWSEKGTSIRWILKLFFTNEKQVKGPKKRERILTQEIELKDTEAINWIKYSANKFSKKLKKKKAMHQICRKD